MHPVKHEGEFARVVAYPSKDVIIVSDQFSGRLTVGIEGAAK